MTGDQRERRQILPHKESSLIERFTQVSVDRCSSPKDSDEEGSSKNRKKKAPGGGGCSFLT